MKAHENKTIGQYGTMIKEMIEIIKRANGKIEERNVVSKMLKTLPRKYVKRVVSIQEVNPNIVANHCLIKLIVEKALQQNLNFSWEDLLLI